MNLFIAIKRLSELAIIPSYAKAGDAGMDLTAVEYTYDVDKKQITYDTHIAVSIPEGYVGFIFPRSSIHKYGLSMCNSVGVIDSGYRGSLLVKFNVSDSDRLYKTGDRIAQLVILPYPQVSFMEVDKLTITERNENGFGSTGQ